MVLTVSVPYKSVNPLFLHLVLGCECISLFTLEVFSQTEHM